MTLRSVVNQSLLPEELIVADDGSDSETAKVVKDCLETVGIKWRHVWHMHRGVRQSRIKNLAVSYSTTGYLIFIDQDVVLHPEFIADHISLADSRVFLQGKRVLLSQHLTSRVLKREILKPPSLWTIGLNNRKNSMYLPRLGRLLARTKRFETSLRGCNLSMHRSDFLAVDGFDETFDGTWGREDSDICYRLFHTGVKIKTVWCAALQYHLHHAVTKNWEKMRLDGELLKNINERRKMAIKGYSLLSKEGRIITSADPIRTHTGASIKFP